VSEGGNYNCIHTLKDHTTEDIPPSAMANIRTVSSLAEVNGVLEEMGINTIGGANQVQFRLHEQASLNIYPNPPFPEDPSFEFAPGNQRVPYQTAFATNEELDAAIYRDKRAQRAFWRTNLRLLERKKSVLEKKKIDLEKSLGAEFCQVIEEQSDLGVGYANFTI